MLGEKTLKDVNALDVQALVYRKRDNGRVQAAMQLRNVIKLIFDYAIEIQLVSLLQNPPTGRWKRGFSPLARHFDR
jgi:hypothetical protein